MNTLCPLNQTNKDTKCHIDKPLWLLCRLLGQGRTLLVSVIQPFRQPTVPRAKVCTSNGLLAVASRSLPLAGLLV